MSRPASRIQLDDICEAIVDCEHKTAPLASVGFPSVRTTNIKNGRIDWENCNRVDAATYATWTRRREPKPGDLILAREAPVGEVGLIPAGHKAVLGQRTVLICPDRQKVDPRYLHFLLISPDVQDDMLGKATGSTVEHLNMSDIRALPLPELPPLAEQRAIARVLGELDDKIELNRRMNRTLEDLTRGLFKSWFVDFDPVTRAATANTPGPPANLFSTRLVDSALGPIPEGWRVSTIGEEVTVVGGSTPGTDEPKFWAAGQHCWITPRDLSKLADPVVIDSERHITDAGLTQISSGLLPKGTVLLSSRAPIGYLAIADLPLAINQGFIGMKCDKSLPGVFVLRWCEQNMDEVLSRAGGTTFAEISKAAFRPIPLVVPPASVIEAFSRAAQGWHDQIVANVRQTRQLVALREAILPQLLSGEIRLAGGLRPVEEVVA